LFLPRNVGHLYAFIFSFQVSLSFLMMQLISLLYILANIYLLVNIPPNPRFQWTSYFNSNIHIFQTLFKLVGYGLHFAKSNASSLHCFCHQLSLRCIFPCEFDIFLSTNYNKIKWHYIPCSTHSVNLAVQMCSSSANIVWLKATLVWIRRTTFF